MILDSISKLREYLTRPILGWNPRPGQDLDSGMRIQFQVIHNPGQVVTPQSNQYGNPYAVLSGMAATFDSRIVSRVEQYRQVWGPWQGIGPQDSAHAFPLAGNPWLSKGLDETNGEAYL